MRYILMTAIIILAMPAIQAAAKPLSLKQAVDLAMERNNLVSAGKLQIEAAEKGIAVANSAMYPQVEFEEDFGSSNSPTRTFMMKLDQSRFTEKDFQINNLNSPAPEHNFKTAVSVEQAIYLPSLKITMQIASKEAENTTAGLEAIKEDVAFRVLKAYLDISRHQARLRAADLAVTEAHEHLRLAQVRGSAGMGLKADQLRAKTHLSLAEQQAITARNNLALAKLQLALLIGGEEPIETFDNFVGLPEPPLGLLEQALANRADLNQARIGQEREGLNKELAQSAYLPAVSASASYQLNSRNLPFGSDNDAWFVGVGLKWNLFQGFRAKHEAERAKANHLAASQLVADKTKQIRYELEEGYLRRREAAQQLELARNALQDAEETVRLLSRRFENSLATMADLLEAQTVLNQVRSNQVDAENSWILAGAKVYRAAGSLLEEVRK